MIISLTHIGERSSFVCASGTQQYNNLQGKLSEVTRSQAFRISSCYGSFLYVLRLVFWHIFIPSHWHAPILFFKSVCIAYNLLDKDLRVVARASEKIGYASFSGPT